MIQSEHRSYRKDIRGFMEAISNYGSAPEGGAFGFTAPPRPRGAVHPSFDGPFWKKRASALMG
jgi:hypothetical protein